MDSMLKIKYHAGPGTAVNVGIKREINGDSRSSYQIQ